MKSNFIPGIILIVLGTLFLLDNLIPEFRITSIIHTWWPVILIAFGLNMLFRQSGSK